MVDLIRLNRAHDLRGRSLFFLTFLSAIATFISEDKLLFLLGDAVLILFVYLYYNRTFPPVLLVSALFQWFFFYGKLLDGLFKGRSVLMINNFSKTYPDIIILGFLGTAFFFVGVYFTARKVPIISFNDFKLFCNRIHLGRLIKVYILIYVTLFTIGDFIWFFPGLSQPLYILTLFRWSMFFLLFITVFYQNKFKGLLLLLVLIDIMVGFFSFFSHFKEAIYFAFLAYWIFFFRSAIGTRIFTFAIIIVTIYLGIYWTAIKQDYRLFLNKGTGAQAVLTTRGESYSRLLELAGNAQDKALEQSSGELLNRLSWIGVFDRVYKRVPEKIPFEEGALWWNGITRPFMPRLFFPEKKGLADSKELNYYSALDVDEKHTSISLSMMAGSYVDFGEWGMHAPLFLFGLFCGWVYSKAIKWGRYVVIGYALTMPMTYLMQINEQSINRMVSAMFLYFLVMWFLQKFVLEYFLHFILSEKRERAEIKSITQIN